MSDTKLKRPLMLLAGIFCLVSIILPLWAVSIEGDIVIDDVEVGTADLSLSASHFGVNVTFNITADDEFYEESVNILYTDLNYTADGLLISTNETDNETIPANVETQYIGYVMPVMSALSGVMMIGFAFVTPKKSAWMVVLAFILVLATVIYFWYAWDVFLQQNSMTFFNESGALLTDAIGSDAVVSGNPCMGFWLLVFGTILAPISIYRTKDDLFMRVKQYS